jgi:hypothetical protein
LHPDQNSNKRLNSAYARLRADAIAGFVRSIALGHLRWSFFGHKRMFEFQMTV